MKYQIKCAEPEQQSMFYSDCEPALRNACVGHVRMDFGSGNEFYSSWWENRSDLNNEPFRSELDEVVNELRKDGLLKNRSGMQKYCSYKVLRAVVFQGIREAVMEFQFYKMRKGVTMEPSNGCTL